MKRYIHIGLILGIAFMVSCSKSNEIKADYLPSDGTPPPANAATPTSPMGINNPNTALTPTVNPAVTTINPQQVVANPSAPTAPGMNPAHGKPGHRCDIPVGAPLNSPPQKTAQNMQVNPAMQKSMQIQPQVVANNQPRPKTAPGMNPPHGEAGHRCDIPVGQPLNSAPQASTTATTPAPAATTNIPATIAAPVEENK